MDFSGISMWLMSAGDLVTPAIKFLFSPFAIFPHFRVHRESGHRDTRLRLYGLWFQSAVLICQVFHVPNAPVNKTMMTKIV